MNININWRTLTLSLVIVGLTTTFSLLAAALVFGAGV
jgi:hypothetical protein